MLEKERALEKRERHAQRVRERREKKRLEDFRQGKRTEEKMRKRELAAQQRRPGGCRNEQARRPPHRTRVGHI